MLSAPGGQQHAQPHKNAKQPAGSTAHDEGSWLHQCGACLCGTVRTTCSVAPYERLYEQAGALRGKLEKLAAGHEAQEAEMLGAARVGMSWISAEMMRDRTSGRFGNYGEMLYAEGLEMLARKQEQVWWGCQ